MVNGKSKEMIGIRGIRAVSMASTTVYFNGL